MKKENLIKGTKTVVAVVGYYAAMYAMVYYSVYALTKLFVKLCKKFNI